METKTQYGHLAQSSRQVATKIFIVDDEPMYRILMEYELKKHPEFNVYTFRSGEDCLQNMKSLKPEIVILDYRLNSVNPKAMNGLQILKRIKEIDPKTIVFMLSSQTDSEIIARAFKKGALDYLQKNGNGIDQTHYLINRIKSSLKLKQQTQRNQTKTRNILIASLILSIVFAVLFNFFHFSFWMIGVYVGISASILLIFITKNNLSIQMKNTTPLY